MFRRQPVTDANDSKLATVGKRLDVRVCTGLVQREELNRHTAEAYYFSEHSTKPPPWICMRTPLTQPLAGLNMRHGMLRPASREGIVKSTPESMTIGLGKVVSPFQRI